MTKLRVILLATTAMSLLPLSAPAALASPAQLLLAQAPPAETGPEGRQKREPRQAPPKAAPPQQGQPPAAAPPARPTPPAPPAAPRQPPAAAPAPQQSAPPPRPTPPPAPSRPEGRSFGAPDQPRVAPSRPEGASPGRQERERPRPAPQQSSPPPARPDARPSAPPRPAPAPSEAPRQTAPVPPAARPAERPTPPAGATPPARPAAPEQKAPEQKSAPAAPPRPTPPAAAPAQPDGRPFGGGQPRGEPSPPPPADARQPGQPPAAGAPSAPPAAPQERSGAPDGGPRTFGGEGVRRPPPAVTAPLPPPPRPAEVTPLPERGARQEFHRLDDFRGQRRETQEGGRTIITEPGRVIVQDPSGRSFVRHDDINRFRYGARDVRVERRGGEQRTIVVRPDGSQIITINDNDGRLLRRIRRGHDGREIIIIDNSYRGPRGVGGYFVDLPPPVIGIPRERYIVEYEDASPDVIYETMLAPPVQRLERRYSLDEIRYSPSVRQLMPRVDLDTITFDTGSWEITQDQADKLQVIADGINRAISRNPREVFLIEGHTDAVGSDVDNLSLSDRRAEAVAEVLTSQFQVPPENLTSQGYGEQYLKVETDGPERRNRRVTVRRITPLLAGQNQPLPPPPPGTRPR